MAHRVGLVYHSTNGFTNKVAGHIYEGLTKSNQSECRMLNVEFLSTDDWEYITSADGLIFGTPTYFGGVSGQFKRFMDQTIGIWEKGDWHGKSAAGFVTAADVRFDAFCCLNQLLIFASQHGMKWVTPRFPAALKEPPHEISRIVVSYGLAVYGTRDQKIDVVMSKADIRQLNQFGNDFIGGQSPALSAHRRSS